VNQNTGFVPDRMNMEFFSAEAFHGIPPWPSVLTPDMFTWIIHRNPIEMTLCRRASGVNRMFSFPLWQNHPAYAGRPP
jgi:hypothetical protein